MLRASFLSRTPPIGLANSTLEDRPIATKRLIDYLPENASANADIMVNGFLNFTAELTVSPVS
jgi:hypothetical protein